jgi:hypothetical protein
MYKTFNCKKIVYGFIIMGKIQFSLPNYHWFFGWHSKLPKLGFLLSKLLTACFLAPSVSLCRLSGWKVSHVSCTWLFRWKAQKCPSPCVWNSSRCFDSCFSTTFLLRTIVPGRSPTTFLQMDIFSRYSDSHPLGSASEKAESTYVLLRLLAPLLARTKK